MFQIKKFATTPHTERRTVGLWQCFITSWIYRPTMLTLYSIYALLPKVLIILLVLVSNFCVLLVSSYSNLICLWELVIPMAWICQLKMLWKSLVLQLRAKRSKSVTNRHKNDHISYVHAEEIEKWNSNALNGMITCANNIQKNCFIVMTALKRRLKIEHFAEQQSLQKYDTFWLFLGYQDILIVIFI